MLILPVALLIARAIVGGPSSGAVVASGTPVLIATDADFPLEQGDYYWLSPNKILVPTVATDQQGRYTEWNIFDVRSHTLRRLPELTGTLRGATEALARDPQPRYNPRRRHLLTVSPSGTEILFHDENYSQWRASGLDGVVRGQWPGTGTIAIAIWNAKQTGW